jgi:uncharacterized protein
MRAVDATRPGIASDWMWGGSCRCATPCATCRRVLERRSLGSRMSIKVVSIHRYPIKGFAPEALMSAGLVAGAGFPGDRVFAVENGRSGFDAAKPEHFPKIKYLQTMRNPSLWGLGCRFDASTSSLTLTRQGDVLVEAQTGTAEGRALIEEALQKILAGEARGPLRLLDGQGWQFMDSRSGFMSIIAEETIFELSQRAGIALDPLRFRANIIVSGLPAFGEFALVGQRVRLGGALLNVLKRIDRCRAIDANPATARHDTDLVGLLERSYDHNDVGIYASVISGGRIEIGDTFATQPSLANDNPSPARSDLTRR